MQLSNICVWRRPGSSLGALSLVHVVASHLYQALPFSCLRRLVCEIVIEDDVVVVLWDEILEVVVLRQETS